MTHIHSFDDSHTIVLGGTAHGVSSRVLKPGEVIGGSYELKSLLGQGGMGYVFCAEHTIIKREYALKILAPELVNEANRRRFEIEGRAIANLDHPNIVKVYNMGLDCGDCPFYVMDLLDGMALSDCIDTQQDIAFEECLDIIRQIAQGLGYAHSKGIIHRDVKPSNIVLLADSKGWRRVKIVDFGIAKLLPSATLSNQTQTATGAVFGSPFYMSPEQCMGTKVDHRTDIYSLGCTFFETICGKPPFCGQNAMETVIMHQDKPVPSILQARPDKHLPQSMDLLLRKMLAKQPDARYQSMDQFMHDLERIKQGKAIGTVISAKTDRQYQAYRGDANANSDGDANGDANANGDDHANGDANANGDDHANCDVEPNGDDQGAKNRRKSGIDAQVKQTIVLLALVAAGGVIWLLCQNTNILKSVLRSQKQPPGRSVDAGNSIIIKKMSTSARESTDIVDRPPLEDRPPAMHNVFIPANPDLPKAQAAFDQCPAIKSRFMTLGGKRYRVLVFPQWPIGFVIDAKGVTRQACNELYLPAYGPLTLAIGGDNRQSRLVLDSPGIIGRICHNEFSGLSVNGIDDHSSIGYITGSAPKTDALISILKAASSWTKLDNLALEELSLTRDVLDQIERCKLLQELRFIHVRMNRKDLAQRHFVKRLQFLSMVRITDVAPICTALANSSNLEHLRLSDCDITLADLMQLSACPHLHELTLRQPNVRSLVPFIVQKHSLNYVFLDGQLLTADEIKEITACANIKILMLNPDDYPNEERTRYRVTEPKVSFEHAARNRFALN